MAEGGQCRGERGTTLVELLIAVTILSVLVIGVVGAMFSSIIVTDVDHRRAEVKTVLVSAAEAVKDQGQIPYVVCAPPGVYSPALAASVALPDSWIAPGSSAGVSVTAVRYWNGATFGGCPTNAADKGLQQVTVSVNAPDRGVSEAVEVVKRSPA